MKKIIKHTDLTFLAIAIALLLLFYLTVTGVIQQYIGFAHVDNEIAFAGVTLMMLCGVIIGIKK